VYFSPAGEVTISVTGTNYSVPQFELPLFNSIKNNLTVGPFLLAYNQTSLVPIQS
jgi:hypothetical protein